MAHVGIRAAEGQEFIDEIRFALAGRTRTARWGARLCLECGERRALFSYRGVVKADRHHTLCFECYRAELNRARTSRSAAWGPLVPMANPRPTPTKLAGDRESLMQELLMRRRRAQIMARQALDAPEVWPAAEALAS